MSEQDLVQLKCPNCGGTLELKEDDFDANFVVAGDIIIFTGSKGSEHYKCQYCGSEFERNQKFERAGGNTVIAASDRSVAIGGSVSGSVIITGNNKPPQQGKYNIIIGNANGISIGDGTNIGDKTVEEEEDE